jgi:hypothetical protein
MYMNIISVSAFGFPVVFVPLCTNKKTGKTSWAQSLCILHILAILFVNMHRKFMVLVKKSAVSTWSLLPNADQRPNKGPSKLPHFRRLWSLKGKGRTTRQELARSQYLVV